MLIDKNDYVRSLLDNQLNELIELEKVGELELSFSPGTYELMLKNGGAAPLLLAVKSYKIERATDPFFNHSGGMLTYCNTRIFFKISHRGKTALVDIGTYPEIASMRALRQNFQWYAVEAVIAF